MAEADARIIAGKKFLWDGNVYDSSTAVEAKKQEYAAQGFETQVIDEHDKFLLYTRRVVKEIVLQGAPPSG